MFVVFGGGKIINFHCFDAFFLVLECSAKSIYHKCF
jgi:hypothetical protein